jgi:microsomal dipeptidase-like Zn-dependent dipeptidase
LTHKLLERGYSEEEVKKILGENLMRVFEETWKPNLLA